MNDIDFDEIDRAVSSVGSDNANDKPEDTTVQPDAAETSKPASQTPQVAPALAGRRSSGQFMDVVHPSSNMRRSPMKMPERPLNQNVAPNTPPTTTVEEPKPTVTELPTPTISNNGWGDSKSENEDADIDKINEDITNELEHKSDELPDTPFISGTKVEKRPLGAFSTESSNTEPDLDDKSDPDDKKDDSLPDELQDKLLSIESKESTVGTEPQTETAEPAEKVEVTEKVDAPATEAPKTESKPAVATSINQQYEEKPSTGDRDSGPIYDTNSYHKPLVSPVKKKSSWKIIIWILGILIVGVGAGVLVYHFIQPIL
jgi:hypothetical protein